MAIVFIASQAHITKKKQVGHTDIKKTQKKTITIVFSRDETKKRQSKSIAILLQASTLTRTGIQHGCT